MVFVFVETCPACFYSNTLISKRGRFRGLGDSLCRCPSCREWVVPIVEKREVLDSTDFNVFKK